MKRIAATVVAMVGILGCRSNDASKPVALDMFHEKAIYATLRTEPIPLPKTTAYDGDDRQRQTFDDAFRSGWECAISGALLHGTFGTPNDLAKEMRGVWSSGWDAGTKAGSDRWLKENRKLRDEGGQQSAAPLPCAPQTGHSDGAH